MGSVKREKNHFFFLIENKNEIGGEPYYHKHQFIPCTSLLQLLFVALLVLCLPPGVPSFRLLAWLTDLFFNLFQAVSSRECFRLLPLPLSPGLGASNFLCALQRPFPTWGGFSVVSWPHHHHFCLRLELYLLESLPLYSSRVEPCQ